MAKKTEKTDKEIIKDDIAHSLADVLNKQFKKDGQVAYFIDGNTPTDVNDWVSTGSSMLDLAISNRPHGGLPIGRIVEFNGLEASGKSLLAAHSIASAQEKGGLGVYIDTENALSKDFLEAIGVDVEKMLYVQLDTVEQIFQTIEQIITTIRESDKNKLVVIVVDSLAAASTSLEMENDYEKQGWNTGKAIVVSAAFRKITRLIGKERVVLIFTNQLRQKMGVMFGDPWTTSGGKGLPFHASIRVHKNRSLV
jgi:recombination protein RecA